MYYTKSEGNSFPAGKRIRAIGCSRVTTWSREIINCSILEVEAETSGYQDGNAELETMKEALRRMLSVLEIHSEMEG